MAFDSPESQAAIDVIKKWICEAMPAGYVDRAALELVGETPEQIEASIQRMVLVVHEAFKTTTLSSTMQVVLPVAAGFVVRDRLKQISDRGRA
jgi:hypothetical protein